MFLTNDPAVWKAAWEFKDHGKSWDRVHATDHPPGFRWLHESIGTNWRLTEFQAAIGRIQLRKLDAWVGARRANARRLHEALSRLPVLRVPWPEDRFFHAFYKFYAFIRPDRLKSGWSRDRILTALSAEGIPGLSGSCPEIYREKAFEHYGYGELPVARQLGETSLMLLVHPTLTDGDIDNTIKAVAKVCSAAES